MCMTTTFQRVEDGYFSFLVSVMIILLSFELSCPTREYFAKLIVDTLFVTRGVRGVVRCERDGILKEFELQLTLNQKREEVECEASPSIDVTPCLLRGPLTVIM